MKHFYISSKKGISGICKYSRDFYELVLKEKGYIYIDSGESISTILSAVSSKDHVHIEIGIFQKKEIEILFLMLKANYRNVSVTLHDAPLLKYPFFEFKNTILNSISKLYEKYGHSSGQAISYARKIKAVYVLSRKGMEAVKTKYKIENVYYLPHIINSDEIRKSATVNNNLIYFGFIGQNKGIEYSLELHQLVLASRPDVQFYIVGKPLGKEKIFYDRLKEKYKKNVHYLGYLEEEELTEVFDKATFAMMLFKNYKFYWPASGSILNSLKNGKITLTNKVNAVPEIIENGKNGFFLTGDLKKDTLRLSELLTNNSSLVSTMKDNIYNYLLQNHSPVAVKNNFKD